MAPGPIETWDLSVPRLRLTFLISITKVKINTTYISSTWSRYHRDHRWTRRLISDITTSWNTLITSLKQIIIKKKTVFKIKLKILAKIKKKRKKKPEYRCPKLTLASATAVESALVLDIFSQNRTLSDNFLFFVNSRGVKTAGDTGQRMTNQQNSHDESAEQPWWHITWRIP